MFNRLLQQIGARSCSDLELSASQDGWVARLTSRIDDESAAFEAELLARERPSASTGAAPRPLELPVFQRHMWLRGSPAEHRLFLLRDPQGRAAMQIALRIERPRRLPGLGRAIAAKLGPGHSIEAEGMAVRLLCELAQRAEDLVSLRLQPYRRDARELRDFEERARRVGYHLVEPSAVTRTLLVDLGPTAEELIAWVTKKTRAKIRHKGRQSIEIRELLEPRYIAACEAAVNASMARTAGGSTRFDFAALFAMAAREPDRVRALGVFFPDDPEQLVAYVIAVRHGELAEYTSAGSIDHPGLRSMPFNYWLVWELIAWARQGGARWLDLGGVTDGGPGDTRAGISDFKRRFSDDDTEVGREVCVNLRPARELALSLWSESRNRRERARLGAGDATGKGSEGEE